MPNWFELMTQDQQLGTLFVLGTLTMLVNKAGSVIYYKRKFKKVEKADEKAEFLELAEEASMKCFFWIFLSVIAIFYLT